MLIGRLLIDLPIFIANYNLNEQISGNYRFILILKFVIIVTKNLTLLSGTGLK